jgi:hypothetical protein
MQQQQRLRAMCSPGRSLQGRAPTGSWKGSEASSRISWARACCARCVQSPSKPLPRLLGGPCLSAPPPPPAPSESLRLTAGLAPPLGEAAGLPAPLLGREPPPALGPPPAAAPPPAAGAIIAWRSCCVMAAARAAASARSVTARWGCQAAAAVGSPSICQAASKARCVSLQYPIISDSS